VSPAFSSALHLYSPLVRDLLSYISALCFPLPSSLLNLVAHLSALSPSWIRIGLRIGVSTFHFEVSESELKPKQLRPPFAFASSLELTCCFFIKLLSSSCAFSHFSLSTFSTSCSTMSGRSSPSRSGGSKSKVKAASAAAAAAGASASVAVGAAAKSGSKKSQKRAALKEKIRKRKLTGPGQGQIPSAREASKSAKKKMQQQQQQSELDALSEQHAKKAKTDNDPPLPSEQEQLRQVKLISFYNSLHIDVLYEWAADFGPFSDAGLEKREEDRDDITSWLMDPENKAWAPASMEDAVINWRTRTDAVSADAPAPSRGAGPSTSGASSFTATAAATATTASSSTNDRSHIVVQSRTSDSDLDPDATCTHCCHCGSDRAVAGTSKVFPCGICFFISGKFASSSINNKDSVSLRAQATNFKVQAATAASSAAAAAASSTTTSSGGKEDNTNKLSAADKELHRVASEGAPFPRFHDTTPISATEALTQIRNTHNGPLYAHVSPHLREVIYEGKLLYPDWAVPRTALEAQAAKERELHGDTIKLSKEGRLSTSAALPHRSLPDLLSYFDAFVSTIGPALFDRPRALLDWFMLSRSVLNIMKSEGDWAIANKYLMTTLSEKVPLRKEFGEFDMRIMHAVAPPIGSMHNHRNNNNNYSSNSGSNGGDSTPSSRTSFLHLVRTECCRKWNFASCKEPCPMGRTHACLWKACSEGNAHTGRKCNHNPDPRSDSMIGPAPPGKGRFPRRA